MEFTAQEIANMVGGTIEGNPQVKVNRLAKIEEGAPGALSFLANPKYLPFIYTTLSSIVLVQNEFVADQPLECTLIRLDDPYSALAKILEVYDKTPQAQTVISPLSSISKSAKIGENVYVGDFSVLSDNVVIGDNVRIYPNCYLGENAIIGANTTIYPGVIIYYDSEIGSYCTIHGGSVVGADGFGFAPQSDNNYKKVAQIGNVIIEDNVEIGANTTIDRATLGSTIIRKGVKLDNLIQIAHNVEIGENTVIAAQSGIAGSTKIGKNCMIGGQVAISGHISIADDVKIGGKAGIAHNITKAGSVLLGSPALEVGRFRRVIAIFNNLDKLYSRIGDLEKTIKKLQAENGLK